MTTPAQIIALAAQELSALGTEPTPENIGAWALLQLSMRWDSDCPGFRRRKPETKSEGKQRPEPLE